MTEMYVELWQWWTHHLDYIVLYTKNEPRKLTQPMSLDIYGRTSYFHACLKIQPQITYSSSVIVAVIHVKHNTFSLIFWSLNLRSFFRMIMIQLCPFVYPNVCSYLYLLSCARVIHAVNATH